MKREKIIKGITVNEIIGDASQEISGINMDSRLIEPGHIFVAVKGTQTDGHTYIQKAIEKGARTVVCENLPETLIENVTYIKVNDTEDVVGKLATTFYGDPTSKLELVGVTGTNGKTTIATLLYNMFRKFGYKTGLISTVCNYIDEEAIPTDHTTPDPITLNKLLGRMADEGCKYAFMEVSSHSVAQKRIGGLKFAGGIFTNLTRDHLDYHKTVENYLKAKKAFFDGLPKTAFALTNLDDKNGLVMTQNTKAKVHTYSLRSLSDFKGKVLEDGFEGMLLDINNVEVNARFDELRTQYEVEKHIAEKERNFHYFLFALGICLVLMLLLAGVFYYNRIISTKNRKLYERIKEQDRLAEELSRMAQACESTASSEVLPQTSDIAATVEQHRLVARLREYLLSGDNLSNAEMNRDEIISALGTNKNLLTDAVRAVTGNSPMEYMRMLKLDEARKMLDHHPELTIEAIAFSCGFNAPSTFYRLFRKQYGISPAEYRKQANKL